MPKATAEYQKGPVETMAHGILGVFFFQLERVHKEAKTIPFPHPNSPNLDSASRLGQEFLRQINSYFSKSMQ